MELVRDEKTMAEKEIAGMDQESVEKDTNDEVSYVKPQKKSVLPKVIIGLLVGAIALVGILLAVQYFNQDTSSPAEIADLTAGVSPGDVVMITEDENGNRTATDGQGNPIDLDGVKVIEDVSDHSQDDKE